MSSFAERHRDRARAESFGSDAEAYERHRPAFPDVLLDELAALGAASVLDVGCGTGKVARELARRGCAVLGVEVDPRMADVARAHGVRVEIARFEDWDDAGRRFDLVTSGDSWHWIEPNDGYAKLARVVPPGGTFVRFWNMQRLDDDVMEALDDVYRAVAPGVYVYGRLPPLKDEDADWLPLQRPFTQFDAKSYVWERRVTGADWAAFTATISECRRLPPERLAALQAGIRSTLERFGETVRVRVATTALFARRDPLT